MLQNWLSYCRSELLFLVLTAVVISVLYWQLLSWWKNQTVKYWPFEVSATDLNSHSVTRNIRERSFILSVTSAVNNSDCWFCLVLTQNFQGRHEGQFLFCSLSCITLLMVYSLEQLGWANRTPDYIFRLAVFRSCYRPVCMMYTLTLIYLENIPANMN